jgi:hypothetical protein
MALSLVVTITVSSDYAQAQQQGKALTAAVKATVEEVDVANGIIKAKNGDTSVWIQAAKDAKVSLNGPADPSFLTPPPARYLQFTAMCTKQGVIKDELKDVVVCEVTSAITPAFGPDDPIAAAQVKDKDTPIKYFIRGQIKQLKNGDLTLQCPGATVKAKLAADCKITAQLTDMLLTQEGDEIVVEQGKELQPASGVGKAAKPQMIMAEWVNVNVKQPLVPKKKGPMIRKPVKSAGT